MKKAWEHSVVVKAPVDEVYTLVADVSRHPEWDKFTKRVELAKEGDANGIGAEWKAYEQMGLFTLGEKESDSRHLTGFAMSFVRDAVPNQRVAWHTHSVPNVGVSADLSYDFEAQGDATKVTFKSVVSVPTVVEKVAGVILRNLDSRQHAQWAASPEQLQSVAEEAHARQQLVSV
jgi:uncharacterized membrane protein